MKMLACHDEKGRIENLIFEPIPPDMAEYYNEKGIRHTVIETDVEAQEIARGYFIEEGSLVERPVIASLAELPVPCVVTIDGEPVTVDDGSLEFEGGTPGVYKIEIDHWPYMPFVTEVVVE